MMFITVMLALGALVGALLWFTGWAEQRVLDADAPPVKADSR